VNGLTSAQSAIGNLLVVTHLRDTVKVKVGALGGEPAWVALAETMISRAQMQGMAMKGPWMG